MNGRFHDTFCESGCSKCHVTHFPSDSYSHYFSTNSIRILIMDHRDWIEALNRAMDAQDAKAMASYFTKGGSYRDANDFTVVGKSNIMDYFEAFFLKMKSSKHQLVALRDIDNVVVCEGLVTYERLDGIEVRIPYCHVIHLENNEISKYFVYVDNTPLFTKI